jgi:hypothetical protein
VTSALSRLAQDDAAKAGLARIELLSVQKLRHVEAQQFLTVTEPDGAPRLGAKRENGHVKPRGGHVVALRGPVHLTLTGKQGSRYAIETSTAWPNWTSAGLTVTNPSGSVTFPAPGANSGAQRFYRAVWR